MRFLIDDPVAVNHKPMTYEVEIKVMHGDADGYNSFAVGPFMYGVDEDALTSLVETLDRIAVGFPGGRGGDWRKYGFQHIEGFYSWFAEQDSTTEEEYLDDFSYTKPNVPFEAYRKHADLAAPIAAQAKWGYFEWPSDITVGDDGLESDLDKYEVVFYDEFLVKHHVRVEKEDS